MRIMLRAAGVTLAVLAGAAPVAAQVTLPDTGEELYRIGCAACHGADGTGVARESVAFDAALPDFSDCAFASREPDADWIAVAHEGGPVRGFDRTMPAFAGAFDVEQLQKVVDYVRGFCTDTRWPRGEFNVPRALVTEKAFPEDEAVWTVSVDTENPGRVVNEVLYEKRFGPRSMIEVAIPFGVAERPSRRGGWEVGLADVAVGVKHTFHHDLPAGTLAAAGLEVVLPTGNAAVRLGSDAVRFEPYLAATQLLGDAFVQAQVGAELSTDRSAVEHEVFWRAVFGRSWSQGQFGRSWTPMLEVLGARQLGDMALSEWSLLPQLQVSLNTRQHVLLNLGVRLPLDHTDTRSTQILLYILWDWFDGALFDGW